MAKTELTPGYRFHPTGVELVVYFLKRKVLGQELRDGAIAELDIYKYAPWDLPEKSCLGTGELEWYFFCPRKKKYDNGNRIKRSTEIGYWKATGKDRVVRHKNNTVGMIKSLIFHIGKSSRGKRTDWVMHEYRLEDEDLTDKGIAQDSYVVCKVFQKEGLGPRNGAQYGRQFNEEEWDDEELGIPYAASTAQVPILSVTSDGSVPNGNHLPASGCIAGCIGSASKLCLSGSIPSPGTANPSDSNVLLGNAENIAEGAPPSDDFFEGLEDYWVGFSSGQNTEFSTNGTGTTGDVGSSDDLDFLELNDLDTPLFLPTTQP